VGRRSAAVRIADTFYATLTTRPTSIDTTGAAQALHQAVRAIRDELPGHLPYGRPTCTTAPELVAHPSG
jgi:hypothetical protein